MKRGSFVWFTKYLIDFMFYSGIAVCIGVPFLFRVAGRYYTIFQTYYLSFCIIFMVAGVFALAILWDLRRMFVTVINKNPFLRENVNSLKRMGICAFIIAAVMALRLFFVITPAILILIAVFMIAGLFSIVLSYVFDQAVTYKLENDLTI